MGNDELLEKILSNQKIILDEIELLKAEIAKTRHEPPDDPKG